MLDLLKMLLNFLRIIDSKDVVGDYRDVKYFPNLLEHFLCLLLRDLDGKVQYGQRII